MTHRPRFRMAFTAALLAAVLTSAATAQEALPKPASAATKRYFEKTSAELPWNDKEDFELASRGFIAGVPGGEISKADGKRIRDLKELELFKGPRPETVNPSMWRNAQLLSQSGLFKVTDRVYQIRGIELANLTVVLGDTGYIVIDTLTTVESAKAAMDLVRAKLGDKPVVQASAKASKCDRRS